MVVCGQKIRLVSSADPSILGVDVRRVLRRVSALFGDHENRTRRKQLAAAASSARDSSALYSRLANIDESFLLASVVDRVHRDSTSMVDWSLPSLTSVRALVISSRAVSKQC